MALNKWRRGEAVCKQIQRSKTLVLIHFFRLTHLTTLTFILIAIISNVKRYY